MNLLTLPSEQCKLLVRSLVYKMQPYEEVEKNRKHIIINNFIGGVSWGLGVTIGLAIVLAILGFVIGKFGFVPFFGKFISDFFLAAIKK